MGGLGLGLKDLSGQANQGFRKWIRAEAFGAGKRGAIRHTPRGFLTSTFKAALTHFTHLQQGGEMMQSLVPVSGPTRPLRLVVAYQICEGCLQGGCTGQLRLKEGSQIGENCMSPACLRGTGPSASAKCCCSYAGGAVRDIEALTVAVRVAGLARFAHLQKAPKISDSSEL